MYVNKNGKLVVNIAEIKDVFKGGLVEFDPSEHATCISFDERKKEFYKDFYVAFYLNKDILKEKGLEEFSDTCVWFPAKLSGSVSNIDDINDPYISYDSDDITGILDSAISFVYTDNDGDEIKADLINSSDICNEFYKHLSVHSETAPGKGLDNVYDSTEITDNPIWKIMNDEIDDDFNKWLYEASDEGVESLYDNAYGKTAIQILLDKCKKDDEDLLPASFKDFGLEFEPDFGSEVTVAEYIINNDIKVLRGYADDYLEEQAAKKQVKTRSR